MPPLAKPSVLIVGAGPTGLMAACELARREIEFKIIDKAAKPAVESRALGVHARTLELLDDLGIADGMIAEGIPVKQFQVYDADEPFIRIDLSTLDTPFPFVLILPQSATESHLRKYLLRHDKSVEQSTELIDLQSTEHGATVKLRRPDGQEKEEFYDWVIGCDGAHSAVRHALGLPFEGGTYSEHFVLADVQIEFPPQWQQSPMTAYTGKDRLLAVFQINEKLYRLIGIMPPDTVLTNPQAPSLEEMQKLVDVYRPGFKIHSPVWLAAFKVNYRHVNTYRKARVFLAGDAAHIHSPAGGQGMNTGMQDAVNLVWKLGLVLNDGAKDRLLDSYQAERLPVAKMVLAGTNFLTRANLSRNPIAKQIRRHLAPVLVAKKPVQHKIGQFIGELSINYHGSPIVFEHQRNLLAVAVRGDKPADQPGIKEWFAFTSGPSAGDRAPDATAVDVRTQKPIRLFNAFSGARHSLLLLVGQRSPDAVLSQLSPFAHAVEQMFGRLTHTVIVHPNEEPPDFAAKLEAHLLYDKDLAIHKKYGGGSACVYLIRPDGHVGYRGQPPEISDVERYFRDWLGIEVR